MIRAAFRGRTTRDDPAVCVGRERAERAVARAERRRRAGLSRGIQITKNEGSRGIPVLRGEKAGEIGPRPSPRKGNGRAAGAGRALGAHLNTRALTLKNWLTQTLGLEI